LSSARGKTLEEKTLQSTILWGDRHHAEGGIRMGGMKKLGIGSIIIGIFIVFIVLSADKIGVGDKSHGFGRKQKIGTLVGLVLIAGGVVIARRRDS
jgi:hypothetical protein